MLSIEDIKNVSFRRANFGGYKPEDVDAFIDDVQVSYEEMMREKENLALLVNKLSKKIDKFYEEENSIRSVISGAQKIAEKALKDAENKTADMIHEASEKSEKMISEAKKEVTFHTQISEKLKSESANLRNQLEEIYEKHMEIIESIPKDILDSEKKERTNFVDILSDKESESQKVYSSKKANLPENKPENPLARSQEEKVSAGAGKDETQDIFSSAEFELPHHKFQNLKFGKNYPGDESKRKGIYSGLFRKKD